MFLRLLLVCLIVFKALSTFGQQCENEDFEFGTVDNWKGYTGNINRNGRVRVNTMGFSPGRHTIMSGSGIDPVADGCGVSIPTVAAGGLFSLRLGNVQVGAQAERITKTFTVEPGKEFFLYKYAVVLEDPQHTPREQPRFEVRVFDKDGNLAPCGEFKVRAGPNAANEGFVECLSGAGGFYQRRYWVRDWTVSGADLSAFVGEQVTVEFLTTDCSRSGHAGYAYVEASCKKLDINLDGFCPSEPGFTSFTASVTEGFKEYQWSNGTNTNTTTYDDLNYGDTISVTVTTFTGCSSTFSRILKTPEAVTINPLTDFSACKQEPFSITASGQNIGFFQWDHDNSTEATVVVTAEADTTFSYQAFDLNGCPTGLRDTVSVSAIGFDVDIAKQDVTCNGISDGQITLTPSNGTEPYTFEWDDGATVGSRSDLPPGMYHVVVRESIGCSLELDIELEEPSTMSVMSDIRESKCTLNDGRVEIQISGGIPPYTYSWQDDPIATSSIRENLSAGPYSVTVTDDNGTGCNLIVNVEVPEPLLDLVIEQTPLRCTLNDGALKAVAQGGSGNYTYLWSNTESTQEITELSAGTYEVTVTDEYGCQIVDQVTLAPAPAPLIINTVKTDAICSFDDGTAGVTISGGESPYVISWSNNASESDLINLPVGIYTVTVTDFNDCSVSDSIEIKAPPPLLELSIESSDAVCNQNDGVAEALISYGTPPYTILWEPTGKEKEYVDSLSVGEHVAIVTDANGCTVSEVAIIGPPSNLMELELEATGESYNLENGSAEVTIYGGEGPYSIQWAPINSNERLIESLSAGLYEVFITDANFCTISDTVTVPVIPPINIPNAFTPNGDTYNENWAIENIENYPAVEIQIFNRWGNLVFKSSGYLDAWAGHDGTSPQAMDTYYYIIDLNIGIKPFTGYVDIIR